MSNPWFRMYSEAIDDEKLRLLAFEDRWHFIALLCCKSSGILDKDPSLMMRKVAIKFGLSIPELGEVAKRLSDVGLIDKKTLQPTKWEKRQYIADNKKPGSNESGDYRGYVYFIGQEDAKTIKIGYSKNPWARLKEFQIGSPVPLSVVATIRTSEVSEVSVHDLFKKDRVSGEWHNLTDEILNVINLIKEKQIHTSDQVANYVKTTRSNYVATTTDTETDTETETDIKQRGIAVSKKPTLIIPDWLPEDVLQNFKEHRAKIKKPMTDEAVRLFITKLSRFKEAGHDPVECINNSIEYGWAGVFEPKDQGSNVVKQTEWKTY